MKIYEITSRRGLLESIAGVPIYFEKGYIAQPTAMPTSRNKRRDHTMYFNRASGRRRLRNPNATETTSANNNMPSKWLSLISPASAQAFRPRAAS